ncbi:MAG: hypothetical protein AB1726_07475 [Planctomycetota bacterium]
MRAAGSLLLALLAGACGAPRLALDPRPGRYDALPGEERPVLAAARGAWNAGSLAAAAAMLAELAARHPDHLAARAFLQDIELVLLEATARLLDLAPAAAHEALFRRYRERAEAAPGAAGLVLAARLAPDPETALALLDAAGALDPGCVWVHYGRSFWLFAGRRFPESREAMAQARALDPGHLPTLRLYSSMLASAGDTGLAIQAALAWLERTRDDPLVLRPARAEALADLAALLVLDGEEKKALALLGEIDATLLQEPARVELVRAAAHQARGDLDLALAAARRAWEEGAGTLLPLVQEAILIDQAEGNRQEEREVWERLLEAADRAPARPAAGGVDFQALLIQLMARSRLERLKESEPELAGAPLP